jgi:hypothetical protein
MQSRLINRAVTPREAGDERAAQGRADDESEHRLFDKKRRRTTGASGSYDVTLRTTIRCRKAESPMWSL